MSFQDLFNQPLSSQVDEYSYETFTEKGIWNREFSTLEKKFISLLNDCDHRLRTASSGTSINALIIEEERLFVSFIKSTENMNLDEVTGEDFVSSDHIVYVYKKCITYLKKVVDHCISIAKKQNDRTLYIRLVELKTQIDREQERIIDKGCKKNVKGNDAIASLNRISNEIRSITSKIYVSESTELEKVDRHMSFSDLYNQPLPSSISENEMMMEDVSYLSRIPKEVAILFRDYGKSQRDIKRDISAVRKCMSKRKYNEAMIIIKKLYMKINKDMNEIGKQIRYIEADGLNSDAIRKYFNASKIAMVATPLINRKIASSIVSNSINKDEPDRYIVDSGKKAVAASVVVGASGAAIGVAIKRFTHIRNTYRSRYMEFNNTVRTLEERCKEEARTFKEDCVDYISITQDMELLIESADIDSEELW